MLWGTGQSLVGLFLSDRTVRQGLDTSRRGGSRGGGGGGERKRRDEGQGGRLYYVCYVSRVLRF